MEEQELESGKIRKFIYVNRKAPHGTIYAHEALEVVLIAAAFEQDVSLAFIDDGVYQLKKVKIRMVLLLKTLVKLLEL